MCALSKDFIQIHANHKIGKVCAIYGAHGIAVSSLHYSKIIKSYVNMDQSYIFIFVILSKRQCADTKTSKPEMHLFYFIIVLGIYEY